MRVVDEYVELELKDVALFFGELNRRVEQRGFDIMVLKVF